MFTVGNCKIVVRYGNELIKTVESMEQAEAVIEGMAVYPYDDAKKWSVTFEVVWIIDVDEPDWRKLTGSASDLS